MQNCKEKEKNHLEVPFSPIRFGDVTKLGFNLARARLVNWVELIFVIRRVWGFGALLWSPPNYSL